MVSYPGMLSVAKQNSIADLSSPVTMASYPGTFSVVKQNSLPFVQSVLPASFLATL